MSGPGNQPTPLTLLQMALQPDVGEKLILVEEFQIFESVHFNSPDTSTMFKTHMEGQILSCPSDRLVTVYLSFPAVLLTYYKRGLYYKQVLLSTLYIICERLVVLSYIILTSF